MIATKFNPLGKDTRNLPYDAEVEYLESTGTQYIDTEIEPNTELSFHCDIFVKGVANGSDYANITGCRESSGPASSRDQFSFTLASTLAEEGFNYVGFGAYQTIFGDKSELLDKRATIDYDKTHIAVDGVTKATYNGTLTSLGRTIYLFGRNTYGLVNPFVGKLFSCSYKLNGTVILDLIPVRKGNVGYMYDKVSGKLFGNQGTGDFVLGADKKPTDPTVSAKSYVQDGLIAMWDGIENAGWGTHTDAEIGKDFIWKNLVNEEGDVTLNPYNTIYGDLKWEDGGLSVKNTTNFFAISNKTFWQDAKAIEIVYKSDTIPSDASYGASPIYCIGGANSAICVQTGKKFNVCGDSCNRVGDNIKCSNSWTKDDSARMYSNGVEQTVSYRYSSYGYANGCWGYAGSGHKFSGAIYCVRLYNRALTDAEIAHNYAVDKERFGL